MWLTLAWKTCASDPLVRETVELQLDGQSERWELVWRSAPELDCVESDPVVSCPCRGFAIAERGELDLVRHRPGAPPERLSLGSLSVQRWAPDLDDGETHRDELVRELARRPSVSVLELADYDHDGRAAEFVLQVAAYGCGMQEAMLVGLQKEGRLGVYGGEAPIIREPQTWAGLLEGPVSEHMEMPCGDHDSDIEIAARLRATPEGLLDETRVRACD